MKTQAALWISILALAACGDDPQMMNTQPDAMEQVPGVDAMEVEPDNLVEQAGILSGDRVWAAPRTYYLKESVFIENGTLTIMPGTTIIGDPGAGLVITRTGKINAVGTAALPITFTAATKPGFRKAGDWGGLVLLGNAPINLKPPALDEKIEGFPDSAGDRTRYGGNDAAHDCGELRYVRIEFAGFELSENNEINGLTLGGCGSATKVEYIQVHRGADDGVEIFGGTVDIKHVLITVPDDDGLDWDFGWVGRGQFVIIQQGANRGNNGFEADNRRDVEDATPRSNPTLYNFTLVGTNANFGASANAEGQRAMVLRRGTAATMRNFIIMDFNDYTIDVDGAVSGAFYKAADPTLSIKNSFLYNAKSFPTGGQAGTSTSWPLNAPAMITAAKDPTASDTITMDMDDAGTLRSEEEMIFRTPAFANAVVDPALTKPVYVVPHEPDFRPTAPSPALMGNGYTAAAYPDASEFWTVVTFAGAMGPAAEDDWTKPWAQYPAN